MSSFDLIDYTKKILLAIRKSIIKSSFESSPHLHITLGIVLQKLYSLSTESIVN
jgi:hypothetical protein